jgi:adenylylsulfate kinase
VSNVEDRKPASHSSFVLWLSDFLRHLTFDIRHSIAMDPTHVVWHPHSVLRQERERLNGHEGCVVWFTGLSGSGKSTVANLVDRMLHEAGVHSFVLDGDNVRHGLNASPAMLASYGEPFAHRFGLTFAAEDRRENIRRIGAVAELFAAAGIVTLTAFVSPYRADRAAVRALVNASRPGSFIEVFVDAPLEVCEARDPKGLYKQARAGQLNNFTGIDDPYEPPESVELRLDAAAQAPEVLARQVLALLRCLKKIS